MQYIRIPAHGDITTGDVARIDLDVLYKGTGAETVEVQGLTREGQDASLWLDEDGKLLGRPVNRRADWLCHLFGSVMAQDVIVGDCVITGPPSDEDGETTGLSEEWLAFLTNAATFEHEFEPA